MRGGKVEQRKSKTKWNESEGAKINNTKKICGVGRRVKNKPMALSLASSCSLISLFSRICSSIPLIST